MTRHRHHRPAPRRADRPPRPGVVRGRASAIAALAVAASIIGAGDTAAADPPREEPKVLEEVTIDKVWSAVRVRFCLLTDGDRQYVAYYNADRRMVVAARSLPGGAFTRFVLPSRSPNPPRGTGDSSTVQGWDSHNDITMAVDAAGHLHLAGNMHVNALTYFRTRKPGDVTSMEQVDAMVGRDENRCTYPKFMTGPDGSLIFHYRDGSSGRGRELYNVYDADQQRWRRLNDTPILDGQGGSNAYQRGPLLGPDGWYHLLWMWRNTPDVATNHDLSYARSRDLITWETAGGDRLELPITPHSPGTIIDPVPVNGGLHNSAHQLGFDSRGRAVATYYKHDGDGDTQAFAARFEDGRWRVRRVSDWEGKHIFRGGGSGPSTFGTSIGLGAVTRRGEGRLVLPFSHWKAGRGLLEIDEETLEPVGVLPASSQPPRYPAELTRTTSDFPGMAVRWAEDRGDAADREGRYVLRWESLGPNRDRLER